MPEKGETALTIIFVIWLICFIGDLVLIVDEQLAAQLTAYNRLISKDIGIFNQPLVAIFTGIGLPAFALWIASKFGD